MSRLTTTWKVPLAASYLLIALMDFRTTGELRSMVVVANGFLKLRQQVNDGEDEN